MYQPPHFTPEDKTSALKLMSDYPFATLLAFDVDGTPFVSHLPLLADAMEDGGVRLVGHMSKANRQWQLFSSRPQAVVLFQGPHAYITPTWYAAHDVPTWNYAVVHARGSVRLLTEHRETVEVLAAMTERFEGTEPDAWRFALPDDLKGPGALTSAIVAFEMRIERLEAKFKLSQNRSEADRSGVERGLASRSDDLSRAVLALMREQQE